MVISANLVALGKQPGSNLVFKVTRRIDLKSANSLVV